VEISEGIQVEYIAIFLAVLFPGALVAFDDELLQTSPKMTALRVYSAGIWHNAVVSLYSRVGECMYFFKFRHASKID